MVCANWGAAPAIYWNDGKGHFERTLAGALTGHLQYAGAIVSGDYDGDGRVDMYIGNWPNHPGDGELNALFRNIASGGHWLDVRLVGKAGNTAGIGARVIVTTSSGGSTVTQMREVTSQAGFRGQSDLSPHFGLGGAGEAATLEVRWPSGAVSTLTGVAADQVIEIVEPES